MRVLSQQFLNSLQKGLLEPILQRVKKDDTLQLAIRENAINIYYRGGNLLKISEYSPFFLFFFDENYDLSRGHINFEDLSLPNQVKDFNQVERWVVSFPRLKEMMDFWLKENPKMEREFQQLVERENNRSCISGASEYFITDIENADRVNSSRFDMTAIRWPASGRRNGRCCKVAFIEMKYGDDCLDGEAGLIAHLEDMERFLSNNANYCNIIKEMTSQFYQLDQLGLLKYKHSRNNTRVQLRPEDKPEFIFLLSNHNPRSTKLWDIITSEKFEKFIKSEFFEVRFYINSYSGYGLHMGNVLSYKDFLNHIIHYKRLNMKFNSVQPLKSV